MLLLEVDWDGSVDKFEVCFVWLLCWLLVWETVLEGVLVTAWAEVGLVFAEDVSICLGWVVCVLLEPAFWEGSALGVDEASLLFTSEGFEVVVEAPDWPWVELEELSPDVGLLFKPARRSVIYLESFSKASVS